MANPSPRHKSNPIYPLRYPGRKVVPKRARRVDVGAAEAAVEEFNRGWLSLLSNRRLLNSPQDLRRLRPVLPFLLRPRSRVKGRWC